MSPRIASEGSQSTLTAPFQFTWVATHPCEDNPEGYSIIEVDCLTRPAAEREQRLHVKSHLEVLRRLRPSEIAVCGAKHEIVPYGTSPLYGTLYRQEDLTVDDV